MIYKVSNSASDLFPSEPLFSLLKYGDEGIIEIPSEYIVRGKWGEPSYFEYEEPEEISLPDKIDVVYLAVREKRFYSLESEIPTEKLKSILDKVSRETDIQILVGLGPFGVVALWVYSVEASWLVCVFMSEEISVPLRIFRPDSNQSVDEVCDKYLAKFQLSHINDPECERKEYIKRMNQYCRRYRILSKVKSEDNGGEKYVELEDDVYISLKERRFDGSHYGIDDHTLFEFNSIGIPSELFLGWHFGNKDYFAYLKFEDGIVEFFSRFYGAHPETKTDFIIRIDAENKKYELALYRQGLKEPVVIPQAAYQLIVFKNKFEDYRSENYNQPRGAWVW